MQTREITVRVDPETANAYEASSEADRRKIDWLLNLKLREVIGETRSLEEIMREISHNAQERGLTPEILESILNES